MLRTLFYHKDTQTNVIVFQTTTKGCRDVDDLNITIGVKYVLGRANIRT